MNVRASWLILWLACVAGDAFPPAAGRNQPNRVEIKRTPNAASPTSILQSVGERSYARAGLLSLSEELESVEPFGGPIVGNRAAVPVPVERVSVSPVAPFTVPSTSVPATKTATTESDSFRSYMETHRKKYYAKYRAQRRRSAYMDNLEEIAEHNKEFEAGNNRFRMGPNAFADMQNSEYRKRLIRLKMDPHRKVSSTISDEIVGSSNDLPEAIDWREKGFKTEQANQKTCGSCYAFSVAYAISAQLMKHIGRVELVSEQQMVDCSTVTGNLGCGGGSLRNTLKYLEQSGGVMRHVDYPYTSSWKRSSVSGSSSNLPDLNRIG
ncbi:procathepsin L-like [Anopheles nili]|uniref:procathepsin L-like n=1 Tax=Anopheles nili TaxID=185578 RepID=UPI00237A2FFF|nr:procathepsin L-like [Anopheles nili]